LWIVFLGAWGLAAVGTSFAAIAARIRLREIMLPVLLFPIGIPLVLSLVEATSAVLRAGDSIIEAGTWMRVCFAFDLIFTLLSVLIFEYILED
jgi:heme exporter protein B